MIRPTDGSSSGLTKNGRPNTGRASMKTSPHRLFELATGHNFGQLLGVESVLRLPSHRSIGCSILAEDALRRLYT